MIRYCKRCVMPDTKPGIHFDADGICSACRFVESKKLIDWERRQAHLREICQNIRASNNGPYDCVVPVSGGKDSVYQVYMMSREYKLRTLAVNVTSHVQTPEGIKNLNSLVNNLGVDLLKIGVRHSTQRKIRRLALFKLGNPNYAEHRVVFAAVSRASLFYNVPLVVWGEDIAMEFGGNIDESSKDLGSAEQLINNDLFRESSFENLISDQIKENELFFYMHPDINELKRRDIRSIYLGYYHWWDGRKNFLKAKEFGFRGYQGSHLAGHVLNYDNIDERLCELHIWFKFLKFGFWRPTDQCCYLIWNGYMSREQAVDLVREKQYEFPGEYLEDFLDYHAITADEFWRMVERWRNKDIWEMRGKEWRLKWEIQ